MIANTVPNGQKQPIIPDNTASIRKVLRSIRNRAQSIILVLGTKKATP